MIPRSPRHRYQLMRIPGRNRPRRTPRKLALRRRQVHTLRQLHGQTRRGRDQMPTPQISRARSKQRGSQKQSEGRSPRNQRKNHSTKQRENSNSSKQCSQRTPTVIKSHQRSPRNLKYFLPYQRQWILDSSPCSLWGQAKRSSGLFWV